MSPDKLDARSIDEAIVDIDIYSNKARYHELFSMLRREDPVRWTTPREYRPFWTITKHNDIVEVQKQPAIFLNEPRTSLNTIEAEEKIRAKTGRNQVQRSIISMDGDEHIKLRKTVHNWFLADSVRHLEADIARIAHGLIDEMAKRGGTCDFVQDVAAWFPLRVIMLILGLEDNPEVEKKILQMSYEMLGSQDEEFKRSSSQGEHMLQVVEEIFSFFKPIVQDRRKHPRNDLASVIANAKIDGEPLPELTVFSFFLTVAIAGHDTTSSSISGGLLALIENPGEMEKLRRDPNPTLMRTAVNEMVRWSHPVKHFFRTAARDYVLRGKQIRAGDSLLMCYPSACRDEEVFPDPFAFRVDRAPNPHLAFGVGPHVCLGQYLARVEMGVFFRELLSRVKEIELVGEPVESRTLFIGGLKRLPIRYSMVEP